MNPEAGRGGWLVVNVRFENGKTVPLSIDTGSPFTFLDKSLEPMLGERLSTGTVKNWGNTYEGCVYAAPKMFLGETPLLLDHPVVTMPTNWFNAPSKGILGMDFLQHYCIQLDFQAEKIRFLDRKHVATTSLGEAFPLFFSDRGQSETNSLRPYIRHAALLGDQTDLLIDTGCQKDGGLEENLFEKELQEKILRQSHVDAKGVADEASLAKDVWQGAEYVNLAVLPGSTVLGLRFLARHLVTLDFPNHTMYLKRTRSTPLVVDDAHMAARSVGTTVRRLQKKSWLPGWSKHDQLVSDHFDVDFFYPDGAMIHWEKKGDPSVYHYEFIRKSLDAPWILEKAWRSDHQNHVLQTFTVTQTIAGK